MAFFTLMRRELGAYFLSLTGYAIIAAAAFLIGASFCLTLNNLQQQPTLMPVTELWYITPFFWWILLLPPPFITMRLFAMEKASGTFETLMTAPVTDRQVVMAKFSAALLFYLVLWLPLLVCLYVVGRHTNDAAALDPAVVCSTFVGILLLGGMFLAAGCCASAMTRSQVVAAMATGAFGLSFFIVGVLAYTYDVPVRTSWQAQVLGALNFIDQVHEFSRGVMDTRAIVLYLSLTFVFLFLTLRIVESRRWK